MSKDAINQYDATAANNTDVGGISIDEGMLPSNVNNALREIMSHLKDVDAGTSSLTSPVISGDLTVDTNTLFVDASADAVGINITPQEALHVYHATSNINAVVESGDANAYLAFKDNSTTGYAHVFLGASGNNMTFFSGGSSERMRLDTSGNLLVGKTTTDIATAGSRFISNGQIQATASGNEPYFANRLSSDGVLFDFRKDGTTVGTIGSFNGVYLYIGSTGGVDTHIGFVNGSVRPANSDGSLLDNALDLGNSSARWDDVYASNTSIIGTSDQNEKQQIASLTDAEIIAAKALSKLFKTFKWNSAVESKVDNARKHTGHIAQ